MEISTNAEFRMYRYYLIGSNQIVNSNSYSDIPKGNGWGGTRPSRRTIQENGGSGSTRTEGVTPKWELLGL